MTPPSGSAGPGAAPAVPPFTSTPGIGGSRLPLAPGSFEVSSGFGGRGNPTGGGWQNHQGIDFAAPSGTTIFAVTGGTVTRAGDNGDGYGNLVIVKKGDTEVLYGHQSRIDVSVGDTVAPGQAIGAVGSTGDSTGPHLHFEVRRGGEAVDPVGYLTALGLRV
nr:M23 family metallopeptidase [Rhodococcus kroppenstedtii]